MVHDIAHFFENTQSAAADKPEVETTNNSIKNNSIKMVVTNCWVKIVSIGGDFDIVARYGTKELSQRIKKKLRN